jgi:hypothetical protein
MKLWYFAHPYSGDTEGNYKRCNLRATRLLKAGYVIYSPITHSHPLELHKGYEYWLAFDKVYLDKCDGIILAPGWKKSKGCRWEYEYATSRDLDVLYFTDLFPFLEE